MSDIKPDQHDEHKERLGRPPYCLSEDKKKDGFKAKWTGQCYCGNVQYEIDQDPVDACYCHCRTCQRTHGATYQWAAIVPKDAMHFKSGEGNLHFYSTNHKKMEYVLPCKVSCGMCQSPIMDEGRNMCLIFPGLIHGMHEGELKHNGPFKASHHMFYESCVEDIANDSIAKFSGKKGEGPMNEAAHKMMPEIKKKQAEKEEKKKREKEESDKEGGDDSSKKQKKE